MGVHGAGLAWNLFLPQGAPVIELLNLANANQYYANQCRWTLRPYVAWQNNNSLREERAADVNGQELDQFRNHYAVDVSEVSTLAILELRRSRLGDKE